MISSNKILLFVIILVVSAVHMAAGISMNVLMSLCNAERRKVGAHALRMDSRLSQAATLHTDYQARIRTMTHSDPSGSLGDRIRSEGFNFGFAGENVAWGFYSESAVMRAWMNSPGHRQNILEPGFFYFGGGFEQGYWTQVFGALLRRKRRSLPFTLSKRNANKKVFVKGQ
ncbi:hypothetical protein G9A89_000181 [Geosiphon pyriformis]|nr:hypothetical protein G9A89_000181 [Geosiphon pyriformis]